jgi:D-alanine-D-alanine ligase-like ATP-grasp enzyme
MENKKKILIVSGGIDDLYLFETSIFYSSYCEDFSKYIIQHAALFPDGKINFPKSLQKNDLEEAKKFDIFEGGCLIKKMNIDVIFYIPNSWKALTTFRAAFELLEIPIVGPSAESQNIAFNKIVTRARLSIEGVKCASACTINYEDKDNLENVLMKFKEQNFSFPVVVKAPCDDDSLGVYIVKEENQLIKAINDSFSYQNKNQILIEKFIPGREIRTAIIQDENFNLVFLPAFEYEIEENDIRSNFYKQIDFKATKNEECKRIGRKCIDPEKEPELLKRLQELSFTSFKALNVHDYAVFDYRYNTKEDEIYFLEAGLFSHFCYKCNVALLAYEKGISLEKLFDTAVNNAIKRFESKKALNNLI